MDIEALRFLCQNDKIKWTLHALKRLRERKIPVNAVINTILTGSIIEQYQDDKPFPSCLILFTVNDLPLHVVVSSDGSNAFIITTYIPTLDEWEGDYRTRKEHQ